MAIVQDTYLAAPVPGYPGMIANGETANRLSRNVEDAAGIGFGKATFRGTDDAGVTATPAAGTFMGITIADHGLALMPGGTADVIPQGRTAGLLNEGEIWVLAGSNTTDGAAVYVTAGGAFTATSTSNTAIPATFDDTVSSGAPVRLRVVR